MKNFKLIAEKQADYIRYLKRAIHSESILANITMGVQDKFDAELAELMKEEEQPIQSAKDFLNDKAIVETYIDEDNLKHFEFWLDCSPCEEQASKLIQWLEEYAQQRSMPTDEEIEDAAKEELINFLRWFLIRFVSLC